MIPTIPELRKQRQDNQEFEVSLNDREVLSPNEQEDHPTKSRNISETTIESVTVGTSDFSLPLYLLSTCFGEDAVLCLVTGIQKY